MDTKEARKEKKILEENIYQLLINYEAKSGLEIAAVIVDRVDVTSMGDDGFTSSLTAVEVVVGIGVPATVEKGGGQ